MNYTPTALVPAVDPETGTPRDLTYATLRSVSPIHVEYLQNMGVHASMSISLLRRGRLWGLIACHHYAGPHLPPFGTRAAAEFLGATLSLRLVDQFEEDLLHKRLASQAVLAKLTAATLGEDEPIASALLGAPDLLDLVPADGVVVHIDGDTEVRGSVPPPDVVSAVAAWARGAGEEIASTECLSREVPALSLDPQLAAGAFALNLPDGQHAIWFRREVERSVDWGGDPSNKAIAVSEGDEIRLSPRKSFERWREIVRERSDPWTLSQTESAEALRRHLVESLYRRTRGALRMAETMQLSLLPDSIPTLDNWQLSAHYEPAAGGRVGGDWYDAFELRDGRLVVVLGDVAGHGITAAGTMAQLRNALRAKLFVGTSPGRSAQGAERILRALDAAGVRHRCRRAHRSHIRCGGGRMRRAFDSVPDEFGDGRAGADPAVAADRPQERELCTEHVHHRARTQIGDVLRRFGRAPRRGDRRRDRPTGENSRTRRRCACLGDQGSDGVGRHP